MHFTGTKSTVLDSVVIKTQSCLASVNHFSKVVVKKCCQHNVFDHARRISLRHDIFSVPINLCMWFGGSK